ncbi:hypothetical protein MO973_18150 [Paenibacillus sp. TRM 82003]|nr:hypothetical protein [Paenibacillus sp. TRM 82003]
MKYDQIGKTYNRTRMPDQRITERIISYLGQPPGSTIIDIGAGTGNYGYDCGYYSLVGSIGGKEKMN